MPSITKLTSYLWANKKGLWDLWFHQVTIPLRDHTPRPHIPGIFATFREIAGKSYKRNQRPTPRALLPGPCARKVSPCKGSEVAAYIILTQPRRGSPLPVIHRTSEQHQLYSPATHALCFASSDRPKQVCSQEVYPVVAESAWLLVRGQLPTFANLSLVVLLGLCVQTALLWEYFTALLFEHCT